MTLEFFFALVVAVQIGSSYTSRLKRSYLVGFYVTDPYENAPAGQMMRADGKTVPTFNFLSSAPDRGFDFTKHLRQEDDR